jgi:hypothetical protein
VGDQSIHDLAVLLNELNEGKLRDEATRELTGLLGYLLAYALSVNKSAKGSFALKLNVSVNPKGLVTLDGEIAVKQPKALMGGDCFFLTQKNGLSRSNPKQPQLPFRAVETAPLIDPETGEVVGGTK